MRTRFISCFAPFFFALIFFSCSSGNNPAGKQAAPNISPAVEGIVLHPQHTEEDIQVSGTLAAWDQAVLAPEVSGRIVMLHLPEGERVSKGTLLVKLYDGDLQAQLQKLNVQLQTAKILASRDSELLVKSGISRQDYDNAVTQVNSIKADLADVNAQITKTEIRAPFDGTIGLRNVSEGAFVTTGTQLAVIRADQQLKLDFSVPEEVASLVTQGLKVYFTTDGDTGKYSAIIFATESGIDPNTRDIHVRARVQEKNVRLVAGGSATVMLALGAKDNALVVPTQAVIPQEHSSSVIVAKKGKAVFQLVTTGIRRSADIEILSGLQPGDTVVTTGIQFIRPGMSLKFSSVK